MYCAECGKKLRNGSSMCSNCEKKIEKEKNAIEKKNNRLANILCTISLFLYVCIPIICLIVFFAGASNNNELPIVVYFVLGMIACLSSYNGVIIAISTLISYVLMIIARVKCPKSKYAKILMWVYISMFLAVIAAFIIIIVACGAYIFSCFNELSKLGDTGMIWR